MFYFIKKCEIHGLLERKEVIKSGFTRKGTQEYDCKACRRVIRDRHYRRNKKKIRERNKLNKLKKKDLKS
jgi:transposase-like protein